VETATATSKVVRAGLLSNISRNAAMDAALARFREEPSACR
jgi:hypothetical protein